MKALIKIGTILMFAGFAIGAFGLLLLFIAFGLGEIFGW